MSEADCAANVKGFIRNADASQGEESDREALRIKACWTEPLVTRAELASSMGIVKWNGAATKAFEQDQEVQLNMRMGILLSKG
jgi:hypothetical protein